MTFTINKTINTELFLDETQALLQPWEQCEKGSNLQGHLGVCPLFGGARPLFAGNYTSMDLMNVGMNHKPFYRPGNSVKRVAIYSGFKGFGRCLEGHIYCLQETIEVWT